MSETIKKFPYTSLFAIIGFFIGTINNPGKIHFFKTEFNDLFLNPIINLKGYVGSSISLFINDTFWGISAGFVMGIIGFIIDSYIQSLKKDQVFYIKY